MKVLNIDDRPFTVHDNEFKRVYHPEYTVLNLYSDLGDFERIVSLLQELGSALGINLCCDGVTHGGFIPIKSSIAFNKVYITNVDNKILPYIYSNMREYNAKNLFFNIKLNEDLIIFSDQIEHILDTNKHVIITKSKLYNYKYVYTLEDTLYNVYIPEIYHRKFYTHFHYYLEDNILKYDNLVHLTMIVKNAGDLFEEVLTNNMPYFDKWTILDTGSTDNTVDIIKRVLVGKKPGNLYQEPFINFRDSRNRCLKLAGKSCKFLIMLDDTYMFQGNIRKFLRTVRSDQFSDSFSIYIKSKDVEYISNRVLKSVKDLKYIYKIHEVVQHNVSVCIPLPETWIYDKQTDYMQTRTISRKQYDLDILFEELDENPDNPRTLYYIAQTYKIIDKNEEAFEYFMKRVNHPVEGFFDEKVDAAFEAARTAHLFLKKPWKICEKLYLDAYQLDKTRPDSLYFIGVEYYHSGDMKNAYEYFKQAFLIGYPKDATFSVRPTISYHFTPRFLAEICYNNDDYQLGLQACDLFLNNNSNDPYCEVISSLKSIYACLLALKPMSANPIKPDKPWLIFVADGGFTKWTGRDIEKKGMGGSETCIIELSRYIQRSGKYNVIVFCNCEQRDNYEGVIYTPIMEYFSFISENIVDTCISSRYSEYIPPALKRNIPNVYGMAHDLAFTGIVIPNPSNFKGIFCLTDWHKEYFLESFKVFEHKTKTFGYGIDTKLFKPCKKVPYKFIYSSFANRGLLPLLQMWPKIVQKYPTASLHIYCDFENNWVNTFYPGMMKEIRRIYNDIKHLNIVYHGWVDKKTLANAWSTSHVFFYPCIFKETFCLTALEAAASKTLIVASKLAGLIDTVGNRGILLEGDPNDKKWQENALETLFYTLDTESICNSLVEQNYNWVSKLTWQNRTIDFLKLLGYQHVTEDNVSVDVESTIIKSEEDMYKLLEMVTKQQMYQQIVIDKDVIVSELYACWLALEKNGLLVLPKAANTMIFLERFRREITISSSNERNITIQKL